MTSWPPYEGVGMLQPSPDWYMSTTFLPSPTSPSSDRSQLLIPPPASSTHYHHYSYSPPTLPITHSAVDSCRWISREQPLLLSPQSLSTSSSLPSPLLPVDQPLHSAHEHGAPSSIASSSTSRLDDPLQQQTARSPGSPTGQDHARTFIRKLYLMLNSPEYSDVVAWDPEGETFIIAHRRRLTGEVLPALFGHSNSASFTRQLNVYQFTRLTTGQLRAKLGTKDTGDFSGWRSPHLRRGDDSKLHLLIPRPSRARLAKQEARKERKRREEGGELLSRSF